MTLAEVDVATTPSMAWEHLTSPDLMALWQTDLQWIDEKNPRGARGVGTTTHCAHGSYSFDNEILDWKPFEYVTQRARGPLGEFHLMYEVSAGNDGVVHLAARAVPVGGLSQRIRIALFGGRMTALMKDNFARLASVLAVRVSAPE